MANLRRVGGEEEDDDEEEGSSHEAMTEVNAGSDCATPASVVRHDDDQPLTLPYCTSHPY